MTRSRPIAMEQSGVWQHRAGGLLVGCLLSFMGLAQAAEIVIYGFEGGVDGWVIPDWAKTSSDYAATQIAVSKEYAEEGQSSLKLQAEFPGGRWTGAYAEREVEVTDWSAFATVAVSVYLPADAPAGLRGRIILTVGDQWQWTEMNRGVPLEPGRWTAISANVKPGSMDWKFFPDESFRKDVRKLGVRIESDKQPAYHGPVFVDHVRLGES